MHRTAHPSAVSAHLQNLIGDLIEPRFFKLELHSDEGQLETIQINSTWPGLRDFMRDPAVRQALRAHFAKAEFDLYVRELHTSETEVDEAPGDEAPAVQLALPGTTAQVIPFYSNSAAAPSGM